MRSPVDVVRSQVAAYNDRDIAAFVGCYSADAVILAADGTAAAVGRDAIRDMYQEWFARNPNLHVHVRARIAVNDWVIEEEEISGLAPREGPNKLHAAIVYGVRDGLIHRAQVLD